jgi:hypothetical protein
MISRNAIRGHHVIVGLFFRAMGFITEMGCYIMLMLAVAYVVVALSTNIFYTPRIFPHGI